MKLVVDQQNQTGVSKPETARIGVSSALTNDVGWGAVFAEAAQVRIGWRSEELPEIWKHQLAVVVEAGSKTTTCGELFSASQPALDSLQKVKEYGKANCRQAQSLIPEEIAWALYYLSILAAQVRIGVCITTLRHSELLVACRWLARCSWLDEDSRKLVAEAASQFVLQPAGEIGRAG